MSAAFGTVSLQSHVRDCRTVPAWAQVAKPTALLPNNAPFRGSTRPPRLTTVKGRSCQLQTRRGDLCIRCSAPTLIVKEPATGVEFPEVQNLWGSTDPYRSVGAGVREKKIAFISVKVYAVTLYVEAEKAAKELGVRARGGFFESDDDFAQALTDGAFNKALQVQLVRDIDGKTFYGALEEALTPRLKLSGDMSSLEQFGAYFQGKNLAKGTDVVLLWRAPETLELVLAPANADLSGVSPDLTIKSGTLCRALFEVYLGSATVVPAARTAWAQGARALLATEEVKRDSRKSGS